MINCPKCGLSVSSRMKECFNCGFPLSNIQPEIPNPAQVDPPSDPSPSDSLPSETIPLDPEPASVPEQRSVEKNGMDRGTKIFVVILCCVFVILVILMTIFALRAKKRSDEMIAEVANPIIENFDVDGMTQAMEEAADRAEAEAYSEVRKNLDDEQKETLDQIAEESPEQDDRRVFDVSETGEGSFVIVNQSGSSEDGYVVIFYNPDADYDIMGYEAWGFDGSHLSYIYVDGILNQKNQLRDTQSSIELSEENIQPGDHSIEVVQYDTDQEDGNIILYKKEIYTVKDV